MAIEAVLFDLDGTLLHTVPDLAVAVNAMLLDLGREQLSEAQVAQYVGKGADNLVHRSLTGSMDGLAEPELFEQAMCIWGAHYNRVNGQYSRVYPGVLEGLKLLKNAGFKLAVVTNKPEGHSLTLLKHMNMLDYFEQVVGGDTCARKKPDPMPVQHALKTLGAQADQAILIGDSSNDAQAAKAAHVLCWLLPYGYNEGRAVQDTPCDGLINTIEAAAHKLLALHS